MLSTSTLVSRFSHMQCWYTILRYVVKGCMLMHSGRMPRNKGTQIRIFLSIGDIPLVQQNACYVHVHCSCFWLQPKQCLCSNISQSEFVHGSGGICPPWKTFAPFGIFKSQNPHRLHRFGNSFIICIIILLKKTLSTVPHITELLLKQAFLLCAVSPVLPLLPALPILLDNNSAI